MNQSRTWFSLLIISLLFSWASISAAHHSSKIREADSIPGKFAPLIPLEDALLYKAGLDVLGDYYSGLVLIKELREDSAIHVVFLNELGLTLLDLAYRKDEFEVQSVQDFLNRSSILKTLQKDFRCLLLDLSLIEKFKVKSEDDGVTETLKFRHKSQRYTYSYRENTGPVHISRRRGLFGKVEFQIDGGETKKINIDHRGIRLKIVLTELKML